MRVLVVGNVHLALGFAEILSKGQGWDVKPAFSSEAAISAAQEEAFDVVLVLVCTDHPDLGDALGPRLPAGPAKLAWVCSCSVARWDGWAGVVPLLAPADLVRTIESVTTQDEFR